MNNYILGKLKSVFFFISTSHLPLLLKRLKLNLYVYPDVTSRFWRTIKFLAKKEPLLFLFGLLPTPDAGRDWGQEEKGTTEDELVGWHHRLDGHEFE